MGWAEEGFPQEGSALNGKEGVPGASPQCQAGAEPVARLDLQVRSSACGECRQGLSEGRLRGGKERLAERVVRCRMGTGWRAGLTGAQPWTQTPK